MVETNIYPIMNYEHMRRPRLVVIPEILQFPGVMPDNHSPVIGTDNSQNKFPGILYKVPDAPQLGELLI